jgi:hypothetical protein
MGKIIFLIVIFLILNINTQWVPFTKSGSILLGKYQAFTFNSAATQIQFSLSSSLPCDMYVMTDAQFQRFQQKLSFVYIFGGTYRTSLSQGPWQNTYKGTILQAGSSIF